jgi:hypothetical protein
MIRCCAWRNLCVPTGVCSLNDTCMGSCRCCFCCCWYAVCSGNPPAKTGINWGACDGTIQPGRRCTGTCTAGYSGSPSIACANDGWDLNSMVGRCEQGQGAQQAGGGGGGGGLSAYGVALCAAQTSLEQTKAGASSLPWGAECRDKLCWARGRGLLTAMVSVVCLCCQHTGTGGLLACQRQCSPAEAPGVGGIEWRLGMLCDNIWCCVSHPDSSLTTTAAAAAAAVHTAVCTGMPSRVLNSRWPASCQDLPAGQTCTAGKAIK